LLGPIEGRIEAGGLTACGGAVIAAAICGGAVDAVVVDGGALDAGGGTEAEAEAEADWFPAIGKDADTRLSGLISRRRK
jgi:hypothetical protein